MDTRDRDTIDPRSDDRLAIIRYRKKEVCMKFLLVTFAVRVVIEMIGSKRKEKINKEANKKMKEFFTQQSLL